MLVGGARIRASDIAVETYTAIEAAGTRTHTCQNGDELFLRARQGRAGHEVLLGPGFFRPVIGDKVVLDVFRFDEADALFEKGVLTVSGFDGKGNEVVTEENETG